MPTPASPGSASGAWDPCNLGTTVPVKSLADLQGKRIFTFPTAGRFLTQFGVVPVTLPWEDVEVAMQTGELDGIWWCGATEIHSVGWSNVLTHYLTNNINGALDRLLLRQLRALGRGAGAPEAALPALAWTARTTTASTGTGGARRTTAPSGKLELTSIPAEEWATVQAAAVTFWDGIAAESERKAKVVQILKDYTAVMEKAGAALPQRLSAPGSAPEGPGIGEPVPVLEEPGPVVGRPHGQRAEGPADARAAPRGRRRRRVRPGQRLAGHHRVVHAAEAVLQLLERPEIGAHPRRRRRAGRSMSTV